MKIVVDYTINQSLIFEDIDEKHLLNEDGTLKDIFTMEDLRALGYKDIPTFASIYGLCIEHLMEMDIQENGITDYEISIEKM